MISRCAALNPGSTWVKREKLLSNNPAPIINMTASATSAITRSEGARRLRRVVPRVPQVILAEASAGASPNSRQTMHEIPIVKASARRVYARSSRRRARPPGSA